MKIHLLALPAFAFFTSCSGTKTDGNSTQAETTQNKVATQLETEQVPAYPAANGTTTSSAANSNSLVGIWDYNGLLPLAKDGSIGTDTTGLGMFSNAMKGTVITFTENTCDMAGPSGHSQGSYSVSPDGKSLTLTRNSKQQVWEIKEQTATRFSYSTGGMPIVVAYKKRS